MVREREPGGDGNLVVVGCGDRSTE